jgi:hypothetical protein
LISLPFGRRYSFDEFFPPGIWNACVFKTVRGVPLNMSRNHPECPDSDSSERTAADALLRQAPEEEEDEEGDGGDGKENENGDDDGKDDDRYWE